PWMAAVTAALIIRVWRMGWGSKLALSALVATQILVGSDVYFMQTHAMIRSPIKKVNDLLSAGYEKRYEQRLDVFKSWTRARDAIPDDAHVLLHDNHVHLGLSRATTSDWGAWQFGISYGRIRSPAELWELYRELGVTHLLWEDRTSKGWDSIAGDLVFFDFALNRTTGRKSVGNLRIGSMPTEPPLDAAYGRVAYLGCGTTYATGLYELSQMTTPVFGPEKESFAEPIQPAPLEDVAGLLDEASFVVLDPDCAGKLSGDVARAGFALGASRLQINPRRRTKLQLYVKASPSRRP
ncbi:MAG TPA: hypothetical protein VFG22_01840, partial [Polyangiales bacterium]|nr:hypothetical protein [Polyangiales bacterium]